MKKIMQWLVANFFKGAVIVLPVVISLYVLVAMGQWLDHLVGLNTPGLGVLLLTVAMIVLGALASNRLGGRLVQLLQAILERVPVLKMLYGVVRDVVEAMMGNKKQFDNPVVVSLNDKGDVKTLGFISVQANIDAVPGFVAVYLPQSFNIAGNLILVPEDRVEPLEMDSAQAMALILSGGIVQKTSV